MIKKRILLRETLATKSDLRRLRSSVDRALEQIIMANAISLKRTLKMVHDLEKRVRRVKRASR
jgi:hypothetical protein